MPRKMPFFLRAWVSCTLLTCAAAVASAQSAGQALFEKHQCGSCHATSVDTAEAFDPTARAERRGPALSHAGVKFHQQWVAGWLVKPTRIRPAGPYPPTATQPDDESKDQIDSSTLAEHPALSSDEAASVADYLATLTAGGDRVAEVEPAPKKLPKRLGALNFGKFKGCVACHRDEPDHGGVSGPELYTVWNRATPEYLFSYIQDPSSWDRHTMMPGLGLKDVEINKLLGYLQLISEEAK